MSTVLYLIVFLTTHCISCIVLLHIVRIGHVVILLFYKVLFCFLIFLPLLQLKLAPSAAQFKTFDIVKFSNKKQLVKKRSIVLKIFKILHNANSMSVQCRYHSEYTIDGNQLKNVHYYSYQVSLCSVGSTMHSSMTGTRVAVKKWLPHRGNELVFMIRRLNTCSRTRSITERNK